MADNDERIPRVRTPHEILADYDEACKGVRDVDMRAMSMRDFLWEVIEDIRASYRLAMENAGRPIDPETVDEVQDAVRDYVVNHYGDD